MAQGEVPNRLPRASVTGRVSRKGVPKPRDAQRDGTLHWMIRGSCSPDGSRGRVDGTRRPLSCGYLRGTRERGQYPLRTHSNVPDREARAIADK
jgi:hypothetical protein